MRRSFPSFALAMVLACEITPEEGVSVTGPATGESAQDDGSETSADADTSGTSEATASASAAGDESSSGGAETMSTFEPGDEMSSGDASDDASDATTGGIAEDGGAYAPCASLADCFADPGLACLKAEENGANGFCSPSCGTMGAAPPDPQLCPPPPAGVTATKVCVEGFVRNCALACAGNLSCPEGTSCLPANGGGGPYCFGI
jgi:hypothetical protein